MPDDGTGRKAIGKQLGLLVNFGHNHAGGSGGGVMSTRAAPARNGFVFVLLMIDSVYYREPGHKGVEVVAQHKTPPPGWSRCRKGSGGGRSFLNALPLSGIGWERRAA